jgi:LmbE family N-acetylglucosaminyl deacetylase
MNEPRPRPPSPPGALSRVARVLTLGWSDTPRGRLSLRRAAGRLARAALRLRSRPLPPNMVASALVVAPHPDDEALGCGGTVALLVRHRAAVHVVFVTDGGASHPSHPSASRLDIAALRRAEARLATGALGVAWERVFFLDERDGTLGDLGEERARDVVARIAGLLTRLAPEAILLPCRRDGSSEHAASFDLVSRALRHARLSPRMLEFPVWSWWNPLLLLRPMLTCRSVWRLDLRDVREAKARAIASYASQTDPIPPETVPALPQGFASMFLCGEEFLFEA